MGDTKYRDCKLNITNKDIQILRYIADRQKGFPVGIVIGQYRAKRLVELKIAEYAPPALPMHLMKNSQELSSVRCTTSAEILLKNKRGLLCGK